MKRRSFLAFLGLAPFAVAIDPVEASDGCVPMPRLESLPSSEYVWEPMQGPHVVNEAARKMMARYADYVKSTDA